MARILVSNMRILLTRIFTVLQDQARAHVATIVETTAETIVGTIVETTAETILGTIVEKILRIAMRPCP